MTEVDAYLNGEYIGKVEQTPQDKLDKIIEELEEIDASLQGEDCYTPAILEVITKLERFKNEEL